MNIAISGNPTPEETAAVVAVLLSRRGGPVQPEPPAAFTPWRASALPGTPGATHDGWRRSSLPR
ncbi:acyl-CoA carboxylase epsilon subunit [Longispora albida]|uniref:acyl-CoA carboxylase epsilon subunit n=1 Tax=Longispora albida TaxID=203523 RepID=UPI00037CAF5E|nr:acyl-CoA carboxylase epsilon subunit [Longispora albida]